MAKARSKKVVEEEDDDQEETGGRKISPSLLPISFKEFAKQPVVGSLFLTFSAIAYMYIAAEKKDVAQKVKDEKQDHKIEVLYDLVRKSDSANAVSTTQLKTLQQLGAIKGIK